MRRILSLIIITSLVITSPASAVTKKISVKPLKLTTTISNKEGTAGVIVNGSSIILFGTVSERSFARAFDTNGQELWNVGLDPNSPSIATAGAADSSGNLWIAGSTSLQRPSPEPTPTLALNPDNVEEVPEIFGTELSAVALWKIPVGETTPIMFASQQDAPVLVSGIDVDKNGVSLVGITRTSKGNAGFVVDVNVLGEFGKSILIGSALTTLDAVERHVDGSSTVIGASAEKLYGKKLAGLTDGVIIKLSTTKEVLSVVRSSALNAKRNWSSATSNLLLGGEVITGKKREVAITKFTKSYVPSWTYRFASTGSIYTSASMYTFFTSTGAIAQLSNWAPKTARGLLLKFDTKGAIVGAFSAPVNQQGVLAIIVSKELGILCVTTNAQTLSIFSAS